MCWDLKDGEDTWYSSYTPLDATFFPGHRLVHRPFLLYRFTSIFYKPNRWYVLNVTPLDIDFVLEFSKYHAVSNDH